MTREQQKKVSDALLIISRRKTNALKILVQKAIFPQLYWNRDRFQV